MVYDYYCVNCGNRFNGEDIKFDIFQLIGIRDDNDTGISSDVLVIPGVIKGNAHSCGHPLIHGKESTITMSLKTLFTILAVNGNESLKSAVANCVYDDNELRNVIENLISTNEKSEVEDTLVTKYVNRIKTLFTLKKGKTIGSPDLSDYECTFYVIPEFLEKDGKKDDVIYTLEYKTEEKSPNYKKIAAPEPIRGYCPKCGKPILLNTGKYPHILIGFLGAQSAGKTTMILSILQDLLDNYYEHGIKLPSNVLCDSRYTLTKENQKLFSNGWLPRKTTEDGVNSFNASLLLGAEDSEKKLVVTFADIAGEQCYDPEKDSINQEAVQLFPLINSCDAYVLCSCLDNTLYTNMSDGNASESSDNNSDMPEGDENEGEQIMISPHAVLRIANGIYDELRDFRKSEYKTPPLCIVMTKADKVQYAEEQDTVKNPFENIKVFSKYDYSSEFNNLSDTFMTCGEDKVMEPLKWCCRVYENMKYRTYVSMMACSATGRDGDTWTVEGSVRLNRNGRFTSIKVYELVDWLLKTIGLIPASGNYRFEGIPSYNEKYLLSENGEKYKDNHYTDRGASSRCEAAAHLYLNPTRDDISIYNASLETNTRNNNPVQNTLKTRGLLINYL